MFIAEAFLKNFGFFQILTFFPSNIGIILTHGVRRPNAKLFAIGVVTTAHHNQNAKLYQFPQQTNRVIPGVPWYLENAGSLPTIQVHEPHTNGRY